MVHIIETADGLLSLEKGLREKSVIACDVEASGLDVETSKIEGIGLGDSKDQYFIPFPNGISLKQIRISLKRIFEGKEIIFHNAKYDFQVFEKYGIEWPEKIHDTMMMSWLIDENVSHSLKSLTISILGREAISWSDLNRNLTLFREEKDIARELAEYCAKDIQNTFDLYKSFLPLLENEGLLLDYEKIELKLIPVLTKMELRGVKVNIPWLKQKKGELELVLKDLEDQMAEKTGDLQVNVRSPKQLEHFIFDVLKYSAMKITGAGKRSTDDGVLKSLVKKLDLKEDDFISLLLKFRELDKLYGTYILALIKQADKNDIIKAGFLQHGTRTGRLASNNPNLQNIPLRNDEWNIRQAFIPREGYRFLIADYSQIELRLLAHFSRDKNMTETFKSNGDIHRKTMELTGTNRVQAKGINFGLIYGMGPRTLAKTLEISEEEAREYIKKFFDGYPQVRFFTTRLQQKTLNDGYVEMITGRKRRFHEIKDNRWYGMIKRQAINTKISGSAADLIKIAMIRLDKVLEPFDAHQLIQIHDEIVLEVPKKNLALVKELVVETMEQALKLRVPIKVEIKEGNCWIKN